MMARKLTDYPEISVNPEDLDGTIDFVRLFGRPGPVHIEIGCGKGTFLVNQAPFSPEVNFLGIERANKYYRWVVDRLGRHSLGNVRVVRADAAEFLQRFVGDGSVGCFHIYFPDPWPKRRHHKRRFFCRSNVQELIRCLAAGGVIKAATDYEEYFEAISGVMEALKSHLGPSEFVRPPGAQEGEWTGTNFERKYIKQAKRIYTAAWKKL